MQARIVYNIGGGSNFILNDRNPAYWIGEEVKSGKANSLKKRGCA